jgi:glycerol-3-phosphate dehydrogenase
MALAAPASGGRMLTLVPWKGRALVGTRQSAAFAQPGDTSVSEAEVEALLADANQAFPALKLTAADVTLVHRGLVPAVQGRGGAPDLRMIPEVCDHAKEGAAGAFTILSAKYSSARGVAEQVTRVVARRLGKRVKPSRTARTVLPGAGIADHEALTIETARPLGLDLSIATIRHLTARYAERTADIVRLMHAMPDRCAPVAPSTLTTGVEVVYVIRTEMAHRLTDIVLRRTGLGAMGHPGDEAVHECARIAGLELGWDATRLADEVSQVNRFYAVTGGDSQAPRDGASPNPGEAAPQTI